MKHEYIKHYKVVDERGIDLDRPLDSFKAPNIPNGTYDENVLLEWQNVGYKELTKRHGVELTHADVCICDKCLDDVDK